MKRIYILPLLLAIATQANAQSNSENYSFGQTKAGSRLTQTEVKVKPTVDNAEKALTVLWSENFTGSTGTTTANGAYTATGANATYWTMGATPHPLASNGWTVALAGSYLKWNSYTPNSGETNFATTSVGGEIASPTIDLSASTATIGISFKTEAMYCCNFQVKPFYIAVSEDDGATWSAPIVVDLGIGRNDATEDIAHPLSVSINLSSVLATNSNQFKFKFIWDGAVVDPNGQYNTHYFWLIDDIEIYEIPTVDALVESSYYGSVGLYYHQIPTTQIAPIDFSANVMNNGSAPLTNVVLGVDVNSGATVLTSAPATIAVGAMDSISTTAQFTPAATPASYLVTRAITQDGTDEIMTNNTMPNYSFAVNDFTYARDNNVPDGYEDNSTGAFAGEFETGPFYDIFTTQNVYGLDYRLSASTPIGAEIYGRLYKAIATAPGFEYVPNSETAIVQVTAPMIGSMQTIEFNMPINLVAGETYLAVIGSMDGAVRVSTAGKSDPQTSFIYVIPEDEWYYITGTPMVRLNFDLSSGLNENTLLQDVSIYPNPANDKAQIAFNLANTATVTINVTDITGKTVESITVENAPVGTSNTDLNVVNYASGIYNVTISSTEGSVTKKFIKN